MTETTTSEPVAPTTEAPTALQLTDRAIDKVRHFASTMEGAEGKPLRIYVSGGGCSGFQYGFTFDDQNEGDTVLEFDDIRVVIDAQSLPYLRSSTVDYVEDMRGAGFAVQNPNASGGCGCGQSFSV